MVLKQWIVVRAHIARQALLRDRLVEHSAQCLAIHIPSVHAKPDDTMSILIHNDQYPMAFQKNGFAPEEVNTPKTIFGMTESGEL